jgi:hypothetical protein
MHPHEMREHIKRIPGLGTYPIRDYEHLAQLLGGKHKVFKFKDQELTMAHVMRMFPANYFPILSEHDLMAKIAKLQQLGQKGFKPASHPRPPTDSRPPTMTREQHHMSRSKHCGGHPK